MTRRSIEFAAFALAYTGLLTMAAWLNGCAHGVDTAPPDAEACATCYDACHGELPEVVHCADHCYEVCAKERDW